ncbi:tetratricopeptide repeat-containing sensor histidine kinase [Winogradskyella vidalii]|uniref:tetratricopeptide repeat-containing sensor histidine kinase n=1 Tax=Winogradskyella vidalii TaxID=2615024 RepID=UPI0015CD3BFC|nr:tetratricopeptide repeat-containing sensor histidine kinase [Winogradskyella vidalii]
MKPVNNSFLLFFCFVLQFLYYTPSISAQNTTDTLNYRELILKPKNYTDLVTGYNYYLNSKAQKLKKADTMGAISDLRLISIALRKKSLFYESENYAIEALTLLDNLKENHKLKNESRVGLYNHLGIINKKLDNHDVAIRYFKKVISNAETTAYKNTGIKNLASTYAKNKDYKKAVENLLSVVEYSRENESQARLARLLDNLGFAQAKINAPEAYSNLNEALEIRLKENHHSGIITSYLNLSEYYSDRNNIVLALDAADKAIKIATESKNKYYEMHALAAKIALNENAEIIRYKTLNDSIDKSTQLYKNQFASNKYEYYKEKERADSFLLLKEKEALKKMVAWLIVLFIALLSIPLYIIIKSKHKKEKIEQVYATESQISKVVHDEVANDVFQIMTKLQTESNVSDDLLNNIEQVYSKARNISKQLGELDVTSDYKTLLNDLAINYTDADTNVILRDVSKIQWNKLAKIKRTAIYKVLQELLINMKKHSEASIAVISFQNKPNKVIITYKDDGLGCDIKKSTGLRNVENRIVAINGSIIFDSEPNKGFKSIIEI